MLETAPASDAERWRTALRVAADRGREDVSVGAAQWLDHGAASAGAPPGFALPSEAEQFGERLDHLGQICRVVLGR